MSAVRRWTWPIRTFGSIGRSAWTAGSMGPCGPLMPHSMAEPCIRRAPRSDWSTHHGVLQSIEPLRRHERGSMGVRKVLVAAALMSAVVAVASGTAGAARHGAAASVTTIKAVQGPPKFEINRFVQNTLRWNKDTYSVPSGGTLHIVNMAADEGPHTFTVVAQKDLPKTLQGLF